MTSRWSPPFTAACRRKASGHDTCIPSSSTSARRMPASCACASSTTIVRSRWSSSAGSRPASGRSSLSGASAEIATGAEAPSSPCWWAMPLRVRGSAARCWPGCWTSRAENESIASTPTCCSTTRGCNGCARGSASSSARCRKRASCRPRSSSRGERHELHRHRTISRRGPGGARSLDRAVPADPDRPARDPGWRPVHRPRRRCLPLWRARVARHHERAAGLVRDPVHRPSHCGAAAIQAPLPALAGAGNRVRLLPARRVPAVRRCAVPGVTGAAGRSRGPRLQVRVAAPAAADSASRGRARAAHRRSVRVHHLVGTDCGDGTAGRQLVAVHPRRDGLRAAGRSLRAARPRPVPVIRDLHRCQGARAGGGGPRFRRRERAMNARLAAIISCALVSVLGLAPAARADQAPPLQQLPDAEHFTIDPVVDGTLVAGGITFSAILSRIVGTGEIRPTPPGSPELLLSIDRIAVTQTLDPGAGKRSDVGLYAAYAYAVLDPILSGVRGGRRALLVDAILYAEAIALTRAFTDATKIGVRRSRPIDYALCGDTPDAPGCSSTDLQLSFFSGHASTTGAISATATYLAFMRAGPRHPRPWITLAVGTLLTAFVSYERVRSGEHFPTDVIMGSLAGAGIGVLVPHFHRRPHYHESAYCAPPVLVGFSTTSRNSGAVTLALRF